MADDDATWDEIFNSQPDSNEKPDTEPARPLSRRELRQEAATPRRRDGRPRRNRRKGWLVALSILLVFVVASGAAVAWVWSNYEDQVRKVMGWELPNDYEGEGRGEVTVVINEGDTGGDIATTLTEAGVTKTWDAFYDLLLKQDPPVPFFPGHYLLKQEMSAAAALAALQDPANKVEASVLIQEGWALDQTLDALAEGTEVSRDELAAAIADPASYGVPAEAPSLEGYLFPARYTFQPGTDARGIIDTLVRRTFQSLDAAGVDPANRHRVMTIASLIQREAGSNREDFFKVSRVIQNRLDDGMLLQFDSTSHYGYAWKHGERLQSSVFSSSAELNDDNPYNTYRHTGLPLGPIGAAGDLAIEAALNPADGSWRYFVTVNLETGETVFSETNAQHNAAVNQLRQWCRQTQSPNCD